MKSQSLKLFAMAFVLGLVTVFGAASASAQSKLYFETEFEFHVGKDTLAAGKYELRKLEYGKFLLKSVETNKGRIVLFDITESNGDSAEPIRVTFNRYGETYFLRTVFDRPGAVGQQMVESNYERQIRKGTATRENQLAGEKTKPERVSVKMSK